ncbi:MAG: ABC transporter ATP-binding protein [Lentisphaerae bacterium]|jgi:oligopeptide/dipeptide ABC transporter ATP-binding protein|nr:ABC transporter ATP-binding protein [Lentisphaerota bacterium]MBT4817694.1 ABC transporter ATP-binding protein [Lentisphaerota bacterium]MBT5608553.1 ABC transporter ATP-binding protein [Lentisphaerota bacterium]MBT7058651.1 ABC transporter ATP-binding protein [Lentisphaerota bacterium]MBT7844536.1 ABC transporter ATP-binding protein [Lentisphaerota bacterium]
MANEPNNTLINLRHLKTWFPIRRGVVGRTVGHIRAVDDVSLEIHDGETVGLVGESGCGKTTLGRTLLGLETATAGEVWFEGTDLLTLSERQMRPHRRKLQMIFQDPFSSLNPRMTVLDIVTEGAALHGLIQGSREGEARRLLQEVGLGDDAMHRYPHEFSGGQRQRLGIARALSVQPTFIVCDEAVSALDVSVQAQVINLLMDLRERRGLSYLFISHDLSVVKLISHRIAVMYLGRVVESGPSREVIEEPLHPYTKALVSAIPVPGRDRTDRIVLEGEIPSPANPPSGCAFHPRCPSAMAMCSQMWPTEREIDGRRACCHLYDA